jgi:hypothetical protein
MNTGGAWHSHHQQRLAAAPGTHIDTGHFSSQGSFSPGTISRTVMARAR